MSAPAPGRNHKGANEKYRREQGSFLALLSWGVQSTTFWRPAVQSGLHHESVFEDFAGKDAVAALGEVVTAQNFRGKATKKVSIMDETRNFDLPRNSDFQHRDDFVLSMANIQLGDYAIIGTFNSRVGDKESFRRKLWRKNWHKMPVWIHAIFEKNILCALDKVPQGNGPTNACIGWRDYYQNEHSDDLRGYFYV